MRLSIAVAVVKCCFSWGLCLENVVSLIGHFHQCSNIHISNRRKIQQSTFQCGRGGNLTCPRIVQNLSISSEYVCHACAACSTQYRLLCPVAMTTIIIPRSSYMLAHRKPPTPHSTCFTAPASASLYLPAYAPQTTRRQLGFAFRATYFWFLLCLFSLILHP